MSLASETDPDLVANLFLDANDTSARKLYNRMQPYNPIYKARISTALTATLLPKQTLGVYSVEGKEKLMTAKEALGIDVIPRTREQVAVMATTNEIQLIQPVRHKLHNSAANPKTALAFLNSSLSTVMNTAD